MFKVLTIDDEMTILENIKFVLELSNYEVLTASSGEEGLKLFEENIKEIDVVITDMKMPRLSGMDVLRGVKRFMPEMGVIILTGHGDMENAILAMKEGAFEYLNKPINTDVLIIAINNAIDKKNLLLDNAIMQNKIMKHNKYLKGLQDSAQKILLNLLPKSLPEIPNYKFSAKYRSCETVGGDMYDVCDIGEYICFYMFDVSSHGILASLITIILKSFIRNIEYNFKQGLNQKTFNEIVSDLNVELSANTAQDIFATLFIGFIHKETNKLYYVSAGHITQFIFNNSDLTPLYSTGTVLGVFEDAPYELSEIQLNPNDKILLFTDGIIETTFENKPFGYEGIISILNKNSKATIEELTQDILDSVCSYSETMLLDDMTLLGIEIL